jgi:hypothetical protein
MLQSGELEEEKKSVSLMQLLPHHYKYAPYFNSVVMP